MSIYSLSDLVEGSRLSEDLFSESGELLLTKGITLTKAHIQLLRKRNIFAVYTQEISETEIRRQPAISDENKNWPSSFSVSGKIRYTDKISPIHLELPPEIERIRDQSLKQLIISPPVQTVDADLKRGLMADRPVGVGYKTMLSQMLPSDRNQSYKEAVIDLYMDCLNHLHRFIETILSGQSLDVSQFRELVERLLKVLLKDRAILLSLSSIKSETEAFVYNHSLNVCILSLNIAAALGYNRRQVVLIGIGALLHDIGMFLVPDYIRNKCSPLSRDEFLEIQKHPLTGLHLLGKIRHLPEQVRFMIYQSHEREDGSGYPRHFQGKRIHGFAKIIQAADIFEALTSPRNYRGAYTPFEAMETLIRMTQKGQIAPPYVRALLSYVSLFPVGSIVELSDHRLARIIQANTALPDRPLVSLLTDQQYRILDTREIIHCDLAAQRDISIIRAFSATHLRERELLDGF
ncbi:MAG: HD-GYP domain-containing protein [Chitinispirillaceae bacterium]